jgi:salicylate hydroxylase
MPLKVIIIGAGLGGLATAVTLTREGHEVEARKPNLSQDKTHSDKTQVYEKSSFHNEVGAAINLQPNASRLVRQWGCDIEALQPVDCKHISVWTPQGELVEKNVVGFVSVEMR